MKSENLGDVLNKMFPQSGKSDAENILKVCLPKISVELKIYQKIFQALNSI